jgi:hypothetical protein
MALLSSFFGDAQGSGSDTSIITDPTKMPFFRNSHTSLYFKYTTNNYYNESQQDFWNSVALNNDVDGTYHTMTADDTWETFVDYSGGAGRLYWIIGPTSNTGANLESWMRITVDGASYTFKSQLISQGEPNTFGSDFVGTTNTSYYIRPLWGSFGPLPSTSNLGNYYGPNNYYGYGEFGYDPTTSWGLRPDKYGVRSVGGHRGIFSTGELMMYGFPYLTFSNSLKIEFYVTTGVMANPGIYFAHRAAAGWMKELTVEI